MEALGAAASIIAIIEITKSVVKICNHYISGVKDAPAELRLILVEVSALKGIIDPIKVLLSSPGNYISEDVIEIPVKECHRAMAELERLMDNRGNSALDGRKSKKARRQATVQALAWPLKRSRAMKLIADIQSQKKSLGLILEANTAASINGLTKDLEDVKHTISSAERNEILKWLVTMDPSSNHSQAYNLLDTYTTTWITATPEYQGWLSGGSRILWLYGIPGAGKTVLASSVINRLSLQCEGAPLPKKEACVYYYCHHARGSRHDDVGSFLGWIVSQLCRQAEFIPEDLRKKHLLHSFPTTAEYIKILQPICDKFSKVYIVIDALDESQSRRRFLSFLQRVSLDPVFSKVSIFVTSRDETDIRGLMDTLSTSLSMSNPFVDRDIATYVHNEFCTDTKFAKWPPDLRQTVEDALKNKAKGMFRWAACQLAILRRLIKPSAILDAIENLPETLDETYERILCSIPKESRNIAHRALQLLCADAPRFSAQLLIEAVFWGDPANRNPMDRIFGIESLQEICICLITVGQEPLGFDCCGDHVIWGRQVRLAHYTVKEYLKARRIKHGLAGFFHIQQSLADSCYRDTILRSLARSDEEGSPPDSEWFDFCWDHFPHIEAEEAPLNPESLGMLLWAREQYGWIQKRKRFRSKLMITSEYSIDYYDRR